MRRAARVDGPHAAILKAVREVGAIAVDTSRLPGFVDQVWGWRGATILAEVKKPGGPRGGKGGQLTPDQRRLHETWTGGTLVLVDSIEAALRVLGVLSSRSAEAK